MGRLLRFDRMLPVAAALAALGLARGGAPLLPASAVGVVWVAAGVRAHRPHPALAGLLVATSVAGVLGAGLPLAPGADLGFVASRLLLAAALLMVVGHRERPFLVLLDALTLAAAIGLVAGVALLEPDMASGVSTARLGYVVADVVAFAAVLRALLAPRRRPAALWLLSAAGAALVVSDAWVAPRPGVGWVLASLLVGLAVLHPSLRLLRLRDEHAGSELRAAAVVLLGAVLLVAPVTLGVHGVLDGLDALDSRSGALTIMLAGSALGALVLLRFALLLRHARRLAEERARLLDTAESRHRALIEQIPAITVLLRLDRKARRVTPVYVSPQTEAMLGIAAADWLEDFAGVLARVHPDDLPRLRRTLAQLVSTGAWTPVELRATRADGAEIWLGDAGGALARDASGTYAQALLFDITQAKRAAAERERMEHELRLAQKLEAVGQLAAGIAHEINTPTQFVGDTVRFLQTAYEDLWALQEAHAELARAAEGMSPELVARVREAEELADLDYLRERVPLAFERAAEGIRRVGRIVGAMREFAHPPTVERTDVDLNAGLRNTLVVATNEYKYVADVVTDLGELPRVICDGGDLNQVFLNLIVNAAHAIETTGARGTITIRTRASADHVTIGIADTGCGMAPEVAERVFDPFFTTKEVGRGTGQGLAIARTLVVERHGGTLTFETTPGEGSTFYVRLPLERRPAAREVAV